MSPRLRLVQPRLMSWEKKQILYCGTRSVFITTLTVLRCPGWIVRVPGCRNTQKRAEGRCEHDFAALRALVMLYERAL